MTMKINKYEHTGIDKYRIYLDNGEIIDTYNDVILENNLLLKKELDETLYQKIIEQTKIEENYIKARKYIEYRIRSTKEIKDYLKKNNIDNNTIDLIIEKLNKNNYLDDDRFCKSFINDKLKFTNTGEYKIITELKRNEITEDIIDKYNYLMNEEVMTERINKIIDKYIKTSKDKSKLRNKIYNNLVRLGYNIDTIIHILNERL